MPDVKNILVVEDEDIVAELFAKKLRNNGYGAQVANNGFQALDKLKSFKPDLIVLDLNMPQMGGVELYQKLCGANGKPLYPIFVVTARANMEELFKDFEVVGFKVKPFDASQLLNEVRVIFERLDNKMQIMEDFGDIGKRHLIIVDNNKDESQKILKQFKQFGYQDVEIIPTGVEALEKMMDDPPDIALINLALVDIPGDLLIFKLQQFYKTQNVICVLYAHRNFERKQAVLENIERKTGVRVLREYTDAEELVSAVNEILKEIQKDKLERDKWD